MKQTPCVAAAPCSATGGVLVLDIQELEGSFRGSHGKCMGA